MKIESKKLNKFIEKISCSDVFFDAVLNFESDKVTCKRRDKSGIAFVETSIPSSDFEDYEIIGEVGISNLKVLKNILKVFKGVVNINVKDNLFCIKSNGKELDIVMPEISFLKQDVDLSSLNEIIFDVNTETDTNIFRDIVEDMSALQSNEVKINISNGEMILETGSEDIIREKQKIDSQGTAQVLYGEVIKQVVNNLSDKCNIQVSSDTPIIFSGVDENVTYKYILAPRV